MKYFQLLQLHNSWSNSQSKYRAFSLIDLTITLALITSVITISIPVLHRINQFYVGAQARMLKTTCWAIRQRAIAENKKFELKIDVIQNLYLVDNQVTKLSPKVKFGIIPGVLGPPATPHHELTSPVTIAHHTIIFYPNGRLTPGSIYLVDEPLQTLYAITIPVASIMNVRLYRYQSKNWQLCT